MHARRDVAGKGEWHSDILKLFDPSVGFDHPQYDTMKVEDPRPVMDEPVVWVRDAARLKFNGVLSLDVGNITFTGGSVLPPSTLKFNVRGNDPTILQLKGRFHAGAIGSVRLNGRWDGTRLCRQAWWPKQSLIAFQPLVLLDWKMKLCEDNLYTQVAFSTASEQGFKANGCGVLKSGSAWVPDNQISGVDFVLSLRFSKGTWQLGTRGPISLCIVEVVNRVAVRNIAADLQRAYPWNENNPLLLSNVSANLLDSKIIIRQLWMPQHDPALLRVQNIPSSELISAVNPRRLTMSGPVSGALSSWLDNEK